MKVAIGLLSCLFLVGCNNSYEVQTKTVSNVVTSTNEIVVPFDAPMSLTTYAKGKMDQYFAAYNTKIQAMHKLFDRYHDYEGITNLKTINDSYGSGTALTVDPMLFDLLTQSVSIMKLSEGYFNPTLGAVSDIWAPLLSAEGLSGSDPELSAIQSALTCSANVANIDQVLVLDASTNSVTFNKVPGCEGKTIISLGAIAKGYALDQTIGLFNDDTVLLDGGRSSTLIQGTNPNPDRDTWNIAILSPYDSNLGVVALKGNTAFSTSGDYEQYMKVTNADGTTTIRHHILNPYTGYSENYYRSISLYSTANATILDALSTTLFSLATPSLVNAMVTKFEKAYGLEIEVLLEQETAANEITVYLTSNFENAFLADQWNACVKQRNLLEQA